MALAVLRAPSARFVGIAAVILFFFAFVNYLDLIPDNIPFTTSTPDAPNQKPVTEQGKEGGKETEQQKQADEAPISDIVDFKDSPPCISELEHLKRSDFSLTRTIKLSRRCINPVFSSSGSTGSSDSPGKSTPPGSSIDRDAVTSITSPLLSKSPIEVDLLSCSQIQSSDIPCDPLDLPVPKPYANRTGQYDHLLFAVATSLGRLNGSKAHFAHWLADSGAPLMALITDKPNTEAKQTQADLEAEQEKTWPALIAEFERAGIQLELVPPHSADHSVSQSHMMVLLDMLERVRGRRMIAPEELGLLHNDTQWLGILDDDTFLPAIEPLSAALSGYDHTQPAYLGDLSESFAATRFGMAAFGGAGIFISVPLAEELEPFLEGCLSGRGGDMQLMECVHDNTHARLERVKGLQQQDMMGDMAGFFESGWRFLTLHHWKTWYHAPVLEMARVADICGGCFLQRWQFGGGDEKEGEDVGEKSVEPKMVLSNGYSIAAYPNGVPDLTVMEGTWDGADGKDYRWSLGPFRPKLDKENKKTWKLIESVPDEETRGLTQIYVYKGEADAEPVDEVIELVWSRS